MRKLMARVVLRSALAISAVGIIAVAGMFDARPDKSAQSATWRTSVGTSVGTLPETPSGARVAARTADTSSYTLRTQGGPNAQMAARVVTATLLLTGLVLTALGAIGMRGPSLARRDRVAKDAAAPGFVPAYIPRPTGHPRFGPPPT
jgi:hypothetical protein